MAEQPARRRTFGPVLALGLASGVLAAVAGTKPWVAAGGATTQTLPGMPTVGDPGAGEMPVAFALALVVLACWGVVLVTRGRFRRAVAVLGAVAAAGLVAAVVVAWTTLPDQLRDSLEAASALGDPGADVVSRTGWYAAAVVGAVGSLVATVLAVRLVPGWPEMGSRYDAPTGSTVAAPPPEDASSLDLWKAIDEGHDPTEHPVDD
ncbi:Trp biosynthesis-associated membrane protein [Nocardioides taihuensis]|uniref:Trp biosynthesis-associated membrane protein n=1 Tax=Nocardioides taihuensis TaxID=1835606 RepID=A0ABW0BND7_9ACTN